MIIYTELSCRVKTHYSLYTTGRNIQLQYVRVNPQFRVSNIIKNLLITNKILFYDCNIKSCEVYLRSNLLGFSNCVDCVDKKANQKEYETLKLKNDMFQIYKDIIYSYWNNINDNFSKIV